MYKRQVRGATQRLVKQELNGQQNDSLVEKIDGILKELQTGEGDVGLTRLNSDAFQELIVEMQRECKDLKEEIYLVRAGEGAEILFDDSETFFAPVSYTHLDVYKRQESMWESRFRRASSPSAATRTAFSAICTVWERTVFASLPR